MVTQGTIGHPPLLSQRTAVLLTRHPATTFVRVPLKIGAVILRSHILIKSSGARNQVFCLRVRGSRCGAMRDLKLLGIGVADKVRASVLQRRVIGCLVGAGTLLLNPLLVAHLVLHVTLALVHIRLLLQGLVEFQLHLFLNTLFNLLVSQPTLESLFSVPLDPLALLKFILRFMRIDFHSRLLLKIL